jgi:hypothetical protein
MKETTMPWVGWFQCTLNLWCHLPEAESCGNDFWQRENVNTDSVSTTVTLNQSMRYGSSKAYYTKYRLLNYNPLSMWK